MPKAEETTLGRIAGGDARAVAECLSTFGGLVYSMAHRYLSQYGEDVEDAVQEIFVEVWRKAARFDPSLGTEAAFIATIARHRLVDRQRRVAAGRRAVAGHDVLKQSLPDHPPAAMSEVREETKVASEAFEKLDQSEKEVLWYALYHGMTQQQIAEVTSIPLGTVKTRARRGLTRLRELIMDRLQPAPAGVSSRSLSP